MSPSYGALKAGLASRRSDFNWAYDSRMPMSVQPEDLDRGWNTRAASYKFFHSCGLGGGAVGTWLDKAEHTRFVSEPVRTVR